MTTTDQTQYAPYNFDHSQEREELDYDNLSQLEKLQIDYTFLQADLIAIERKYAVLNVKLARTIEIVEPFKEDNAVALMAWKALTGVRD